MNLRPSDQPQTPKHRRAVMLAEHQGWVCPLCSKPIQRRARFGSAWGLSLEHVWPKSKAKLRSGIPRAPGFGRRGGTVGNSLAAHGKCNTIKGDREPHPCELIWLVAVNARIEAAGDG